MIMFWVVVLGLAGLVLIMAEFLVPGGILGAIGGILVLVSGGIGVYAYPDYAVFIVLGEVVVVVFGVLAGFYVLSHSGLGRRFVLDASQDPREGWVSSLTDEHLVGAEGEVHTPLRPSGAVLIGGKRIGAVAQGEYIDRGERIRVLEVHGNRVVVGRAEREDAG
jgi:membrane-bound serine protease (ClpP class)